ncbi:TspO/MBR family protein [Mycetocola reblochoni]|uniref:Tryptophan-rich sensory protein n=2 Tax=Mycetocola reblochoni TaxID=331618 RepID=A0A1R4KCX3_9MICO|nr:TspO/MBR family protein [Mycetocola reblochoni]RLP71251.1 tryptophan-rich sensory protein [Mycetocola reblochoni]SJN42160.1 Tryptophan-rich sensory protein [Mycetocola reblochoni REB411]
MTATNPPTDGRTPGSPVTPATPRPPLSRQIVVAVLLLAAVFAVASLGSLAAIGNTDGWYATVEKVPWNPPNSVFGPAWTVLYLLMAVAGYLVWRRGFRGRGSRNAATGTLVLFAAQLLANGLWTPVFFAGYPVAGVAAWWAAMGIMVVLIVLVVALIVVARRVSVAAAILLLPYLAWLLFASTLNAGIIALNG